MSIGHDGTSMLTLGELTKRASQRWPEATALVDGPRQFTFGELDRAVTRIAHELLARGVRHGDRVVIIGPHSAEQVAIMLGVATIGAVFIPLDPELPELRIFTLLAEAQPRLVVSPAPVTSLDRDDRWLPWQTIVRCMDAARDAQPTPPACLDRAPAATDVVYMIFTSGSSGPPKCVQIEHRSLLTFFETYNAAIGITCGDRCLNTGAFHFDVCLLDVFLPLYFGATVYLGPRLPVPSLFLRALSEHRITHFYAVGTWLTQITGDGSALDGHDLSAMKVLQTGAEVCKPAIVNHWLKRLPQLRFVNSYGPTEVTVGCLQYVKPEPGPLLTRRCSIGTPHAGTRVKLMDSEQRVLDTAFTVGELLIGGTQLMRGYWNAADRTCQAIATLDGEPYYRSGDLAYRDDEGSYWFVGRRDDQVKFLGHRFHLCELQNALTQHPDVCSAVAGVVRDPCGREQLALIAQIAQAATPELAQSMRAHLRQLLPRHMLPGMLGMLRRWPRLTSGKADMRTCLTELAQAAAQTGRGDYVRSAQGFRPLTGSARAPAVEASVLRP